MNPFITPSTMTQLYVAASVSMLVYYSSIWRRRYVTRSGILPTTASPWRHLYENGEVSFLNLTWFSRESFEEMQSISIWQCRGTLWCGSSKITQCSRWTWTHPLLSWFYNEVFRVMYHFRMHTNSLQCIYQSSTYILITKISWGIIIKPESISRILWQKKVLADLVNWREPQVDDVIWFTDGVSSNAYQIRSAKLPITMVITMTPWWEDIMSKFRHSKVQNGEWELFKIHLQEWRVDQVQLK